MLLSLGKAGIEHLLSLLKPGELPSRLGELSLDRLDPLMPHGKFSLRLLQRGLNRPAFALQMFHLVEKTSFARNAVADLTPGRQNTVLQGFKALLGGQNLDGENSPVAVPLGENLVGIQRKSPFELLARQAPRTRPDERQQQNAEQPCCQGSKKKNERQLNHRALICRWLSISTKPGRESKPRPGVRQQEGRRFRYQKGFQVERSVNLR